MKQRAVIAAFCLSAPLVAFAGIKSGLLSATVRVPLWYLLLAAPFWEEILFRGGLQRFLMGYPRCGRLFLRLSCANWATSCCFAAAHLPFQGWAACGVLAPSLVLGWLFERSGRILPCILLHAWFNLSWLLTGRILGS